MCPFVEKSDSRCRRHLTLGDLRHAFTYCADRHLECPVYIELARNALDHDTTGQEASGTARRLAS